MCVLELLGVCQSLTVTSDNINMEIKVCMTNTQNLCSGIEHPENLPTFANTETSVGGIIKQS